MTVSFIPKAWQWAQAGLALSRASVVLRCLLAGIRIKAESQSQHRQLWGWQRGHGWKITEGQELAASHEAVGNFPVSCHKGRKSSSANTEGMYGHWGYHHGPGTHMRFCRGSFGLLLCALHHNAFLQQFCWQIFIQYMPNVWSLRQNTL